MSIIGATSPSNLQTNTLPQLTPREIAQAMIAEASKGGRLNNSALLKLLDGQIAKDSVLGAAVESEIKGLLGNVGYAKLTNASYSVRAPDGSTLTFSRNAPSLKSYYDGTATPAPKGADAGTRAAYTKNAKDHYARLDKMFGDGNPRTFEGAKIEAGFTEMAKAGFGPTQFKEFQAWKTAEVKKEDAASRAALEDLGQMALDIVGIFDPTPTADLINAGWSAWRGDGWGAFLSVISAVPYIGDAAKLGKLGKWASTIANAVELAAKNPKMLKLLEPALKKISDLIGALPKAGFDALPKSAQDMLSGAKSKIDDLLGAGAKKADDVLLARAKSILGDLPLNTKSLDDLFKAGKLSMDEARALAKNAGWKSADNKWIYPPNNGFDGAIAKGVLNPPAKIDRYGGWIDESGKFRDTGNFFSPAGSSYGSRALPTGTDLKKLSNGEPALSKYEIVKPIDVASGKATSWFDEVGGGIQHMSEIKIENLIRDGYIKIVK